MLKRSLEDILKNYRAGPDDLPEAVRELWFDSQAGLDDEDHELWLEHLNEFRGENSLLIERLSGDLESITIWPAVLFVSLKEADCLLTVMNDHRLYLAAVYEVGEMEMNEDWEEVLNSPEKHAIVNIHFLAWLIELVIMRLDDSGH